MADDPPRPLREDVVVVVVVVVAHFRRDVDPHRRGNRERRGLGRERAHAPSSLPGTCVVGMLSTRRACALGVRVRGMVKRNNQLSLSDGQDGAKRCARRSRHNLRSAPPSVMLLCRPLKVAGFPASEFGGLFLTRPGGMMIWDRGGETATGRRNSGQEQQRAEMCMDIYIYVYVYICACVWLMVL
jgi:hypothetical protein